MDNVALYGKPETETRSTHVLNITDIKTTKVTVIKWEKTRVWTGL